MNERIQKIANQCYYINTHTDLEMFNKDKFAELIIQDVLKEIYDDVQYITDFDTADSLVASIRKHFGVTE